MRRWMVNVMFIYVGLFFSCKQTLAPAGKKNTDFLKPGWIDTPPVSNDYYIGVVRVSKIGNYQQLALTRALESIATSISVVIKSNSLLSTFEEGNSFRESFESTIETEAKRDLEGYEIVDAWSGDHEYWIYCRLSKAKFAMILENRKSDAVHVAMLYYDQAVTFEHDGDYSSALRFYALTLNAIRNYLGESIRVTKDQVSFDLGVKTYSSIQTLLDQMFFSVTKNPVVLDQRISYRKPVVVLLEFKQGNIRRPVSKMPFLIEYDSASHTGVTDESGRSSFFYTGYFKASKAIKVTWKVHAESLFGESVTPDFRNILLQMFSYPSAEVRLEGLPVYAYFLSEESNLNKPLKTKLIQPFLSTFLSDYGISVAPSLSKADLVIDVKADTDEGGSAGDLFIAYLNIIFKVIDRRANEVVYTGQLQHIKGVKLSFEQAGIDAYKNAQEKMKTDLSSEILNIILR